MSPNYTRAVTYLDTVQLHFPPRGDEALQLLRQRFRGQCQRGIEKHFVRRTGNGMIEVKIHRPVERMLVKVSAWIAAGECQLVGVDIAQDFMAGPGTIEELRGWIDQHLIQRNRRDVRVSLIGQGEMPTRYMQRKGRGRGTVIYSDRASKVTHQECVHVEIRFRGLRALRRAKLVDNLPTLIDPNEQRKVWDRVVRFAGWNAEKVAHAIVTAIAKATGKPPEYAKARRIAGLHLRLMQHELGEHEITASVVATLLNRFGVRTDRLMPAIDISHLNTGLMKLKDEAADEGNEERSDSQNQGSNFQETQMMTEAEKNELLTKMKTPSMKFDKQLLTEQAEHSEGFQAYRYGSDFDPSKGVHWQTGYRDAEKFAPRSPSPTALIDAAAAEL